MTRINASGYVPFWQVMMENSDDWAVYPWFAGQKSVAVFVPLAWYPRSHRRWTKEFSRIKNSGIGRYCRLCARNVMMRQETANSNKRLILWNVVSIDMKIV